MYSLPPGCAIAFMVSLIGICMCSASQGTVCEALAHLEEGGMARICRASVYANDAVCAVNAVALASASLARCGCGRQAWGLVDNFWYRCANAFSRPACMCLLQVSLWCTVLTQLLLVQAFLCFLLLLTGATAACGAGQVAVSQAKALQETMAAAAVPELAESGGLVAAVRRTFASIDLDAYCSLGVDASSSLVYFLAGASVSTLGQAAMVAAVSAERERTRQRLSFVEGEGSAVSSDQEDSEETRKLLPS